MKTNFDFSIWYTAVDYQKVPNYRRCTEMKAALNVYFIIPRACPNISLITKVH